MRILWLSHFVPYPPAGGALQRSYHLLRHAASRHEVHLLALHQPRLLPTADGQRAAASALGALCASVSTFPIPAERSAVHRVLNVASSVLGGDPFDVTWLRSAPMAAAIGAMEGAGGYDLVHVDTIGLWPYVASWTHVPRVLGHHNIESDLVGRRASRERSWKAKLLERDAGKLAALERRAGTEAAVNLVVSALDGERLQAIAPGAITEVVDNGVDTDYWRPSPDSGRGIVFAGTLGWYPNRDAVEFLLTEVWPKLAVRPDRRLSLIGRDPPAMARDAAVADSRVQVPGFVPDVRPYLRDASIFVCPIRVGGGTRLKILDALAMAKPLVSTAIGVEGLDLVEGVHYLRAESAQEFVSQIERFEREPDLRRALGDAGRRLVVERYDWSVIGAQLDQAYSRALGGRAGARVNRMKIVHMLAPALAGGVERVVQALSIGQQRRGHEVVVVAIADQWSPEHPFAIPLLRANVQIQAVVVPARAYRRERRILAELFAQIRPDIVHSHGSHTDVVDRDVAGRAGIATVATSHGMTRGSLRNRFYEYLDKVSLRRFDAVAAVSRSLADELERSGVPPEHLHVVPNAWSQVSAPLDRAAARRELGLPAHEFVAGWVGRMSQEKGLDVFIDALSHLLDVPIHACAIGAGPDRATQEPRAVTMGLRDRVHWTGLVQEAGRCFHAFDLLVLSSRTEGVPMVLLEAMALGIPVVAPAVGGIPDVVSAKEAILVPSEQPAALAAAIRSVYEHRGEAEARAASARERIAREFSEDKWLSMYDEVYRAAHARAAGRSPS